MGSWTRYPLYSELLTKEKHLNSLKLKSDDYQKKMNLYEEANTALNNYINNLQSHQAEASEQ